MASFGDYLNQFKAAKNLVDDKALAAYLGKSKQYVSLIRHRGQATNELCIEIADAIGVEAGVVLVARNALKEDGPVGDAWKALLGKVAGVGLLIGASLIYSEGPEEYNAKSLIPLFFITGSIAIALAISALQVFFQPYRQ